MLYEARTGGETIQYTAQSRAYCLFIYLLAGGCMQYESTTSSMHPTWNPVLVTVMAAEGSIDVRQDGAIMPPELWERDMRAEAGVEDVVAGLAIGASAV